MGINLLICITMAITVATINVNGLRNPNKRDIVFDYFTRTKTSIVLMQETHSEHNDEHIWRNQWGGDIVFSHGQRNSKGVAILISGKCGVNILNTKCDSEGRWVTLYIIWKEETYSIMCVYAPNIMYPRIDFFNEIKHLISEDKRWIIGGDFNCQVTNNIFNDRSAHVLQNIMHESNLIDLWQTIHPDEEGYTFYHKGLKRSSRIDYIFVSQTILNEIMSIGNSALSLTDHRIIVMRLNKENILKGPGRWMCNNLLLNDEHCKIRIERLWTYWKTKKGDYNNILDWWDMGKTKIKEIIKEFGIEKGKEDYNHRNKLQKAYEKIINNPLNHSEEIKKIEIDLKSFEIKEWEKSKSRLHNIHRVEGEKPTKYFLSSEKQQIKDNAMKLLLDQNNKCCDTPFTMIRCVNDFYQELFSTQGVNNVQLENILNSTKTTTFDDEIIEDLNQDISERELFAALSEMNQNKSPGLDGLTVEFYLQYWPILKDDFTEVVSSCNNFDTLPKSMNIALVRLIFKNRGERSDLKNWRPISLLNVDYKIIAKTLSKRLQKIMPYIVNDDQTCGVKGRNINDNLLILRDVIDYVNYSNKHAAILGLDQEKAFDRIEWKYMYSIMEKMGIPDIFIHWIKILYQKPMSAIIVNNFITEPFCVSRGIRQGCPLFPLLFSICAEGLANLIRTNFWSDFTKHL